MTGSRRWRGRLVLLPLRREAPSAATAPFCWARVFAILLGLDRRSESIGARPNQLPVVPDGRAPSLRQHAGQLSTTVSVKQHAYGK